MQICCIQNHSLGFNVGAMPKRKVDDYFFKCYGIPGVNDAAVRRVIQRLKNEDGTGQSAPTFAKRFQHLENALLCHEEHFEPASLYGFLDEKSPNMERLFRETLVAEHSGKESISDVYT